MPAAPLAPADVCARLAPGDALLDVRTPAEYAGGHLAGAALMDVMGPDFADRAAGLDPSRTYYLYCRSGNRSAQATEALRALGLDAHNAGGFDALARAGFETA